MKKAGSDPALVRARSGYFFSIDDFLSIEDLLSVDFLSDDFLVDAFFSVDLAGAAFFSVDFAGAAFFAVVSFSAFLSCAIAETLIAANAAASNTVTSCFIVRSPSLQRV